MHVSGTYDFYYRGDNVGIDKAGDLYDLASLIGLANRAGSWYQWGDLRAQGRDKMVDLVREHYDALLEEVHDRLRN